MRMPAPNRIMNTGTARPGASGSILVDVHHDRPAQLHHGAPNGRDDVISEASGEDHLRLLTARLFARATEHSDPHVTGPEAAVKCFQRQDRRGPGHKGRREDAHETAGLWAGSRENGPCCKALQASTGRSAIADSRQSHGRRLGSPRASFSTRRAAPCSPARSWGHRRERPGGGVGLFDTSPAFAADQDRDSRSEPRATRLAAPGFRREEQSCRRACGLCCIRTAIQRSRPPRRWASDRPAGPLRPGAGDRSDPEAPARVLSVGDHPSRALRPWRLRGLARLPRWRLDCDRTTRVTPRASRESAARSRLAGSVTARPRPQTPAHTR